MLNDFINKEGEPSLEELEEVEKKLILMVKHKIRVVYSSAIGKEEKDINVKLGYNDNGDRDGNPPGAYLRLDGKIFTDKINIFGYCKMPKEIAKAIDKIAEIQLMKSNKEKDVTYRIDLDKYKYALNDIRKFLGCKIKCNKDGTELSIDNENKREDIEK